MIPPFDFKLPLSGKPIQWKPLNVGAQISLAAAYQNSQKVYLQAAMLAQRICKYVNADGKESGSCSLAEIQTWDEIDYNAFAEDVELKEAQRYQAFKKREDPRLSSMKLQKAASEARESLLTLFKALDDAVEAAKATEAGASPLSPA